MIEEPMSKPTKPASTRHKSSTEAVHSGRDPSASYGFVNPPVYRGSTVVFPTLDALMARDQPYTYGRRGTPTVSALQEAICKLEGGDATFLTASGLQAVTTSLLAFVEAGDHVLITDSVYQPTRHFCDTVLARLGVTTTYYDPCIGSDLAALITPQTRVVFTESPGSQTFEVQDIPAISEIARTHNLWHVTDNTWASPLYFDALAHGADVSIQAATKYIVGHADAMLGAITTNTRAKPQVLRMHGALGVCPGSEETYLGLRGLRTLPLRLERHFRSALEIASWLEARPEIERVLHPGLPNDPGHAIWKRDFTGASGLFSAVLSPAPREAVAAFVDSLEFFGMGYSWGGYESLILPFDPRSYRTATKWEYDGQALRFHIGLEDVDDLKTDLEAGFARFNAARQS
ncbi:cystathionine beta-lyase [Filomicrobium insigne]|uniref:Cystathionine beta-lyase n=2 Tax=Filomicrobium insigne TaxID=418854 RepID=A0A1H0SRW4_9HYPH|nr:cystathionine beta-lyase [Filomicrobium insigne]